MGLVNGLDAIDIGDFLTVDGVDGDGHSDDGEWTHSVDSVTHWRGLSRFWFGLRFGFICRLR